MSSLKENKKEKKKKNKERGTTLNKFQQGNNATSWQACIGTISIGSQIQLTLKSYT